MGNEYSTMQQNHKACGRGGGRSDGPLQEHDLDDIYKFVKYMKKTNVGSDMLEEYLAKQASKTIDDQKNKKKRRGPSTAAGANEEDSDNVTDNMVTIIQNLNRHGGEKMLHHRHGTDNSISEAIKRGIQRARDDEAAMEETSPSSLSSSIKNQRAPPCA